MACAGSPRHVTAALAVIALVPAGCFPLGGPKAGELRSAAASLVPRHSRVLEQSDSDCVEFEPSPSCRLIYFIAPPRATLLLAREVETKARNAGWSVVRKDVFQGGTELRLKRSGLSAYVSLAAGARASVCRQRPSKDCASLIDVSVD
jgi:hypothetical protein